VEGAAVRDDDWEQQRQRAILAAFQTGRPVFADTDGAMRFADGDGEPLAADVGIARQPVPRAVLAIRAQRASHRAFVSSIIAAIANAVSGLWHPWQFAVAAVFVGSAVVWRRLNQHQRAVARDADAAETQGKVP